MSKSSDIELRFPWIPLLFGAGLGVIAYGLGCPDRTAVLVAAASGMGCWISAVVVVIVGLAVASKGGR